MSEHEQDSQIQEPFRPPSIIGRCARFVARFFLAILLIIVAYFLIVLIGLIPVNNDFEPTPNGVEVHLTSTAIHADVVLPIKNETINWRDHLPAKCFKGDTSRATHVAIGWGDKSFYVGTPTWDDLRASTVVGALFWMSESCMHVTLCDAGYFSEEARSVKISAAQYKKLVEFINKSFREKEDGAKIHITNAAYGSDDAFFEAHGNYHVFNTCNCWTGAAMRSAEIRTGWFTPLPKTMFLYLPD